jgi:hypothetical protein
MSKTEMNAKKIDAVFMLALEHDVDVYYTIGEHEDYYDIYNAGTEDEVDKPWGKIVHDKDNGTFVAKFLPSDEAKDFVMAMLPDIQLESWSSKMFDDLDSCVRSLIHHSTEVMLTLAQKSWDLRVGMGNGQA